jgi:hypothetical protein
VSVATICRRALLPALLLACLPARLDASDGIGRMIVTPTRVVAGSTGNTLTFAFTADNAPVRGQMLFDVAAGWTPPQLSRPAGAGFVSLDRGTCGVGTRILRIVGRRIVIAAACGRGAQYKLTYAAATAPKLSNDGSVFVVQTRPAAKPRRGKRRVQFLPLPSKKQPVVVVVGGPVDHLALNAPTIATAGTPFSVIARAEDTYGNPASGYTGIVSFSSSDPNAFLPTPYQFTATDFGAKTLTGIILRATGTQTITVSDNAGRVDASNPITVNPF